MQPDSVVEAHKKLFYTKQAEIDAVIMADAFTVAESAPDFMSRMRLAAEHFRKHAVFSNIADLNEEERRQDIFVVAKAFNFCDVQAMKAAESMKWIACCFRLQSVNASAPGQ